MPDPTVTYEPYAAGVLTEMGIKPYISGGKWRFELDEVQMMALFSRVYSDGKERGQADGHIEKIPGWVHELTVTFDGDTHWLACDFCDGPVHGIDAGDSFETILTKARDHRQTCTGANGADQ